MVLGEEPRKAKEKLLGGLRISTRIGCTPILMLGRGGSKPSTGKAWRGERERVEFLRMKPAFILLFVAAVLLAEVSWAESVPTAPANAQVRKLIKAYQMQYLPGESGYYGGVTVSGLDVAVAGKTLKAHSSIYYLMTRELPINYLHRLDSDDVHVLVEGGPVEYLIFHPDGKVERRILGRDLAAGQSPMVSIPGGCWKALRLLPSAPYALMVNVLSPQWTPDRVEIGAGPAFIHQYADAAPWASAEFLRTLIGPNWRENK